MLEIWLLLKKYWKALDSDTWGPLWNKLLNKIIPFDVAFEAACRKDSAQKPPSMMKKILIGITIAVAGSAATYFFTDFL